MQMCLNEAQKGFGQVSPNPMVGCVIVHNDQVISASYHKIYGGPHAEVNAIQQLEDHNILKNSTVYVSLEPCAHFGKTPPCASLLIEKQVKKVVIATKDPFAEVSGRGIQMLEDAGIEVVCGVLEKEAQSLNRRFFINQTKQRPYVILKWAESKDGFIGNNSTRKISGKDAQLLLHQWRSEEDAFLVGTNTLIKDNPQLNTRLIQGKNPIRIAVDFQLHSEGMPLHFYETNQKTILLNGLKNGTENNINYIKLDDSSVSTILKKLHELKIGSLVVEGGTQLINSFIKADCYDEVRRFSSKNLKLETGIPAPDLILPPSQVSDLGEDILTVYKR